MRSPTRSIRHSTLIALALASHVTAQQAPTPDVAGPKPQNVGTAPANVTEILRRIDERLIAELAAYTERNPKADDIEQAYLALFDRILDLESYATAEPIALRYLSAQPDGASRPIAGFIRLMAQAEAGKHAEALATFQALIQGFERADEEEFALQVADTFARAEIAAAEYGVTRKIYEAVQARLGDSPEVRGKVADTLSRLDRVGKPAPPIQADDIQGTRFRLADYRGKYVLLDFWATFCAPCVADLPALKNAYARYKDRGFEVLAVSLDDTREDVIDFVKARKVPWRQVHNGTSGEDLVAAFRVNAMPCSFLIDPEGKVIRLDLHGKALDAALATLLAQPVGK